MQLTRQSGHRRQKSRRVYKGCTSKLIFSFARRLGALACRATRHPAINSTPARRAKKSFPRLGFVRLCYLSRKPGYLPTGSMLLYRSRGTFVVSNVGFTQYFSLCGSERTERCNQARIGIPRALRIRAASATRVSTSARHRGRECAIALRTGCRRCSETRRSSAFSKMVANASRQLLRCVMTLGTVVAPRTPSRPSWRTSPRQFGVRTRHACRKGRSLEATVPFLCSRWRPESALPRNSCFEQPSVKFLTRRAAREVCQLAKSRPCQKGSFLFFRNAVQSRWSAVVSRTPPFPPQNANPGLLFTRLLTNKLRVPPLSGGSFANLLS